MIGRMDTEALRAPCPFTLTPDTAAEMLRERAKLARQEGDMTANVDAGYFEDAASIIERLAAEVRMLRAEVRNPGLRPRRR